MCVCSHSSSYSYFIYPLSSYQRTTFHHSFSTYNLPYPTSTSAREREGERERLVLLKPQDPVEGIVAMLRILEKILPSCITTSAPPPFPPSPFPKPFIYLYFLLLFFHPHICRPSISPHASPYLYLPSLSSYAYSLPPSNLPSFCLLHRITWNSCLSISQKYRQHLLTPLPSPME